MAVFPEAMNRTDPRDTTTAIATQDQYIRYMVERIEFAIRNVKKGGADGGEGGTANYAALTNKPRIENVVLTGNKTFSDLGLNALTNLQIEQLLSNAT